CNAFKVVYSKQHSSCMTVCSIYIYCFFSGGKSAVLTALIVGLGGKATVTNRGSSLKVFVKDGQSSADVSITLRNRGEDAFKPEQYGDCITINQHITSEGHRSYKLKSNTGILISSKKEELTAILDHFNIQVDNPVSVLTQEMSKQFLQSKNEGDKYKFFMKATQLEQMKDDYSYIMETKQRTSDQVEQGGEFLEELRKQYLEKEERYRNIAALSEMQNELQELQRQIAWAMVIAYHLQCDINEFNLIRVKEWQVFDTAEVKHRTMQDELEKITEEAQTLEPLCIALKTEVHAKRKGHNDAEVWILHPYAEQISEPDKVEKQKTIDRLKEKLKTLQDQDESIDQQIIQFQQAVRSYDENFTRLRKEENEVKKKLGSQQQQLRQLKESKTNSMKRFGSYMPDLCEAIDAANAQAQFTFKPVGPLGAFIHLKDPELTVAVEACLKNLLLAFCCDNHKDERVLQALMSKCCQAGFRPPIIVTRFQNNVYDVKSRAVFHPNFPTVLTALDIDNSVVANCLIDMRSIETVLLIKSNYEARRVMQHNKPPKYCKEAFTADGDQVFEERYYSSENRGPRFLSRDVEADISNLEREVENRKTHILAIQQRIRSTEIDVKQNKRYLTDHQQHKKELQITMRKTKLEITDLENVEESVVISTLVRTV
uniref:Structural maintenance of chromosomes protein 6 n=1 Tax=Laticauda laticaudata TaxID=8630 RepID=A0A8C5WRU0_LATLA